MLAGVDLGWPSNTRPLHMANQFEWHCWPVVLVPFGLLAGPATDQGLVGLVRLRHRAAIGPTAQVGLVRAHGARCEGCPQMGLLVVPMGLARRMRGDKVSPGPGGRVRTRVLPRRVHGPGPRIGQGVIGTSREARGPGWRAGCGLGPCIHNRPRQQIPGQWWPGPWPMPNGHGPAPGFIRYQGAEVHCSALLALARDAGGGKAARRRRRLRRSLGRSIQPPGTL